MIRPRFHYTLAADGRTAVPVDAAAWAAWYPHAERRVRQTRVGLHVVSTVFLGLDITGLGRLALWETAVFSPDGVAVAERYASIDDAVNGHTAVVQTVARNNGPDAGITELFDCTTGKAGSL